ncbi:MAG: cofactor-independent phosphoglycerate mutase, partial [Thermodesulfobacteriota bacterium]
MPERTKYVIIVGDGMADYPVESLGGKTPLMVARTPNMDWMSESGEIGLVRTVPDGFNPGSEVANLSIFGYDPIRYYTGRGPLEAASLGIKLADNDIAFRCNLVTLRFHGNNMVMEDFSAGHITDEEARKVIIDLNKEMATDEIRFYAG